MNIPEFDYLGFHVVLVVLSGPFGESQGFYPVIYKNGTWISEFGCSWDDQNQAEFAAIERINELVEEKQPV